MIKRLAITLSSLFLTITLSLSIAAMEQTANSNSGNEYIAINVGVDLKGVERASENVKAASFELADAIRQVSQHPELKSEQVEQLNRILEKMDTISSNVNQSVKQLPDSIKAAQQPISESATAIRNDIRSLLIKTAIAAVLLFIGALASAYIFILRPCKKMLVDTSKNLSNIAQALEKTALLVEKTNEHCLHIKTPEHLEKAIIKPSETN